MESEDGKETELKVKVRNSKNKERFKFWRESEDVMRQRKFGL